MQFPTSTSIKAEITCPLCLSLVSAEGQFKVKAKPQALRDPKYAKYELTVSVLELVFTHDCRITFPKEIKSQGD